MFFEHHHATHLTITTSDALIHTGQELCAEPRGKAPGSPLTKKAVKTLMNIFKSKASRTEVAADAQRVRKAVAMAMQKETEKQGTTAQRVPASEDDESAGTTISSPLMDDEKTVVSAEDLSHEAPLEEEGDLRMTSLEVTYPSQNDMFVGNIVSQDEDGPSQ